MRRRLVRRHVRAPASARRLAMLLAVTAAATPLATAHVRLDGSLGDGSLGAGGAGPAAGVPVAERPCQTPEDAASTRAHYRAALEELRAADLSGLDQAQREARARMLAELEAYCERGDFGVHLVAPGARIPLFVDTVGRRCAVANLLDRSGEQALVLRIADTRNEAYVAELADVPELGAWLDRVGLTLEEAARIQAPSSHVSTKLKPMVWNGPATYLPNAQKDWRGAGTAGAVSRDGTGAATGAGASDRRGGRTGATGDGRTRSGAETSGDGVDDWEAWWEMNKLRFLVPNRLRDDQGRTYAFRPDAARPGAAQARGELVPMLREMLADRDAGLRARAAVALGRLGGAKAVDALRPLLADPVVPVRHAALLGLGATGAMQAAPLLLGIAETGEAPDAAGERISPWARPIAVLALGIGRRHGLGAPIDGFVADLGAATRADGGPADDDLGTAVLIYQTLAADGGGAGQAAGWAAEVLADEERGEASRCRAASALAADGDPSRLPELSRALGGADLEVRRAAALALGSLPHPLAGAELRTAYELEKEPVARGFLLIALAEQGGEGLSAYLRRVVDRGASVDRPWAALALGLHARRHGDADAREAVGAGLASERRADVRGAWMLAAGIAGDAASAERLRTAVAEAAAPTERMYAALALGMLADEASRPLLLERLPEEGSPLAVVGLSQALGVYGVDDDAPALLATLRDHDAPDTQVLLSVAMGFHGTSASLAGLLDIARDAHAGAPARAAAVEALGLMLDPAGGLVLADVSRDANFLAFPGWVNSVLVSTTL